MQSKKVRLIVLASLLGTGLLLIIYLNMSSGPKVDAEAFKAANEVAAGMAASQPVPDPKQPPPEPPSVSKPAPLGAPK